MLNYPDPVDQVFHALGDPTRRQIVDQLSHGPASVSELATPLPMSLPAVVQHLHVLEDSGLVELREDRPSADLPDRAGRRAPGRAAGSPSGAPSWERRLDRLGEYLAEDTDDQEEEREMSERSTEHATFVIERSFPRAARARVRRLGRGRGEVELVRCRAPRRASSSTSRSAARERFVAEAPDGARYTYAARYQDIVPDAADRLHL